MFTVDKQKKSNKWIKIQFSNTSHLLGSVLLVSKRKNLNRFNPPICIIIYAKNCKHITYIETHWCIFSYLPNCLRLITDLPDKKPRITGVSAKSSVGDLVTATCTSWQSNPPANLSWFINGEPVRHWKFISKFDLTL